MSLGGAQHFPAAALETSARRVSVAIGVALAGLVLSFGASGIRAQALAAAGAGALLVAMAGSAPVAYDLESGALHVRRRWFGTTTFRCSQARPLPWQFGLGGVRLFASGGAFGWYGLFWRRDVGRYRAYVTDRGRAVVCDTDGCLVVVSPADPDAFLEASKGASPIRDQSFVSPTSSDGAAAHDEMPGAAGGRR